MIELTIIDDKCIKCGECVSVCPAHILQQKQPKAGIDLINIQTCIGCGHCVAICPTDAVDHSLFVADRVHAINREILPSPDAVFELLRARRSNRSFGNKQIPKEYLDKIVEAAGFAPTASNGQKLQYTLVTDPEVLKGITDKTLEVVSSIIKKVSNPVVKIILKLVAPDILDNLPYLAKLVEANKKGEDLILRDAKAVLLIHAPEYRFGVPDGNLAYQNASIMAQSLGVGHFYTGYVYAFSKEDKKGIIRKYLGIDGPILAGMALGMPKYTFKKYIDRKPQVVNHIK